MILIRTDIRPKRQPDNPDIAPSGFGYGPADLQSAYALPSDVAGQGQTVAIIDAFDDPDAASDLATYRAAWGLPACGSGCFSQVNQSGQASPLPAPSTNSNPGIEESIDVDMVSAICPNCHILLVEADSASIGDLGTAVNAAVGLGADFVSNSYGLPASSSDPLFDAAYFNHPGVVITAAAGDSGYGVSYPAASQYVTSVGGTTLTPASNARGWTETAWSGTGSGCSVFDVKPSWQADTGCAGRTVGDVSAVADPATGVAIYDTFDGVGGWREAHGTSVGAPIVASIYALAGSPTPGTYPASYPYLHASDLFDITSGSNGTCSPAYLCTAGAGYDGPTGLGTPDGIGAFNSPPKLLTGSYTAAENADGRLEAFATAADGTVWHAFQLTPGGGWSGWYDLGADLAAPPTVTQNADGRLEIFGIENDGHVYHNWQTTPGGPWNGWVSLGAPGGGLATTPSVAQNADGRLEIFSTSPTGVVWHKSQNTPGGTWSGWASLGGDLVNASPNVTENASGSLAIFGLESDGHVYYNTQATPGGTFGGWVSLGAPGGGLATTPGVTHNADGRLEIFSTSPTGVMWHRYQNTPGGNWAAWVSLGGDFNSAPTVTQNADGSLAVFDIESDGHIYVNTQASAGGTFGGWVSLSAPGGGLATVPAVTQNADGRLEFFVTSPSGIVWHNWQLTPHGSWRGWVSLR